MRDTSNASNAMLEGYLRRLDNVETVQVEGKICEVTGLVVRAKVPRARVGDLVTVSGRAGDVGAEVVGFDEENVVLMPLGSVIGLGPGSRVRSIGEPMSIRVGDGLLGRVVDGLGVPMDGGPALDGSDFVTWSVERSPPDPLARQRIREILPSGVRAIDSLMTLGRGQRVGLFAGSGVGKSTLMGQVARRCEADVNVICLVGERGREVREFIEEVLGERGLARSVVVCATSDLPSMVRLKAAFVATAIAEWFRDTGRDVMLMVDSVTRVARAQREVGLAAGEPPARRGYPPSVFSLLPGLLERAGRGHRGSITGLYTVLVEGGDMEEPIADEVRGILDGHILLSRKLAARNHWPAIDVLPSLSRVMQNIVDEDHRRAASSVRRLLAAYESKRELISLGAYAYGSDPTVDRAIDVHAQLEAFLQQDSGDEASFEQTRESLLRWSDTRGARVE